MNSQPTERPHPERMRPLLPILNKNPSPVSKLENSIEVAEQGQGSTNDPDPGQYFVLEALREQRHGRRPNRWLGQLRYDCCSYLILLTDVLGVQHIKRRRKVLVGQMLQLDRYQLAIRLSTTSF